MYNNNSLSTIKKSLDSNLTVTDKQMYFPYQSGHPPMVGNDVLAGGCMFVPSSLSTRQDQFGCHLLRQASLCASIAVKANMGDAVLVAVKGFQGILLAQKNGVDTAEVEAQSLESLLTIAGASYIASSSVWCVPAVRAM